MYRQQQQQIVGIGGRARLKTKTYIPLEHTHMQHHIMFTLINIILLKTYNDEQTIIIIIINVETNAYFISFFPFCWIHKYKCEQICLVELKIRYFSWIRYWMVSIFKWNLVSIFTQNSEENVKWSITPNIRYNRKSPPPPADWMPFIYDL